MNEHEVLTGVLAKCDRTNGPWWESAVCEILFRGHYLLIPTRAGDQPYMLRMWLSPPKRSTRASTERWDSANSLLLHYFFRGDDDEALHDHPWDFRTRLLVGCYDEHLPPLDWHRDDPLGPDWCRRIHQRVAGETIEHQAADLHCVGAVWPGTFTLVETGPEVRAEWGFHPPGQPWISSKDYLAVRS